MKVVALGCAICVALLLTSCGGGGPGGGIGGGTALNTYEAPLVGDYVLIAFEVRIDGVWYDETDFTTWAGTLSLDPNRDYGVSLVIEGVAQDRFGGPWSATAITFYDGNETAGYSFDGTILTFDYTDVSTGDREIQVWRQV